MGIFSWLFGRKKKKSEFSEVRSKVFNMPTTVDAADKQVKELVEMEHMVYQTKGYIDTWKKQYSRKSKDKTINEYTFTAWTKLFTKNVAAPYMRCMEFIRERAKYAFVQDGSGITRLYDVTSDKQLDEWAALLGRLKSYNRIDDFEKWAPEVDDHIDSACQNLDTIYDDLHDKVKVLKAREKRLEKVSKAA